MLHIVTMIIIFRLDPMSVTCIIYRISMPVDDYSFNKKTREIGGVIPKFDKVQIH